MSKTEETDQFIADYIALCLYYKLYITSCCGNPFLKDMVDEKVFHKFMEGLRKGD